MRDRNCAPSGDDDALREARRPEPVLQRRAVREPEPARTVEQRATNVCRCHDEAEVRLSGEAVAAGAARGDKTERYVVAGRDVDNGLTDRLDDACSFVADDCWPATGPEVAVREPHVGVTHADRGDANEYLTGLRRVQVDVLDLDGLARSPKDGSANAHHPIRYRSSASKSGTTPRPGPGGGPMVPSAAIARVVGSSQSRRSALHAGGSNGTSRYGQVENASAA